jgi:hypothetical protein
MLTYNTSTFQGTVTDGQFSSLRTQRETRPLHIVQMIHDAKESVGKQSKTTLLSMLIKEGGLLLFGK